MEGLEVKFVEIGALKEHPKNPRVHPDSAIDKLVRSIKEFGWTNPILVSKDGYVIAGHARLKAAKKLKLKTVPVIYLPFDGEKAEAYMIADNRLHEETEWDTEKLKELLDELTSADIDATLTGFNEDEIDNILNSSAFITIGDLDEEGGDHKPLKPLSVVIFSLGNFFGKVNNEVIDFDTLMDVTKEANTSLDDKKKTEISTKIAEEFLRLVGRG